MSEYENLLEELNSLEVELRDKARKVRECPECQAGWIFFDVTRDGHKYSFSKRCDCFKAYRDVGRKFNRLVRKYEKKVNSEYPPIHPDASDLGSL